MLAERNPPKLELQPNLSLPILPVDSPEFQRAVAGVQFGTTEYSELIFNTPADWAYSSDRKSKRKQTESMSVAGRWLFPASAKQNEFAIALHGYGCSHLTEGKDQYNYFRSLCAAMKMPFYALDWPGYNCQASDRRTLDQQPWMAEITQYPYVLLEFLESFIEKIPADILSANSSEPLILNLIGHSVGGRALAEAASVNEGEALTNIRENWSRLLGRDVQFKLSLLEPAFGIHTDPKIAAFQLTDTWLIKKIFPYIPQLAITIMQELVSTQAKAYGVAKRHLYPLHRGLRGEDFHLLVSQPGALSRRPENSILSTTQLQKLGHSVAIIIANNDRIADNGVTREIFNEKTGWSETTVESWPQLHAEIKGSCMSIVADKTERRARATSASISSDHTAEITDPDAVAKLLQFLHS